MLSFHATSPSCQTHQVKGVLSKIRILNSALQINKYLPKISNFTNVICAGCHNRLDRHENIVTGLQRPFKMERQHLFSIVDLPNSVGPHIVNFPINLSQALAQKVSIRTQARACTILPEFVGYAGLHFNTKLIPCSLRFLVHNGMDYVPVTITEEMIGHKLGEFSPTRKRFTLTHSQLTLSRHIFKGGKGGGKSG
jgi:ribosomal protein S19